MLKPQILNENMLESQIFRWICYGIIILGGFVSECVIFVLKQQIYFCVNEILLRATVLAGSQHFE